MSKKLDEKLANNSRDIQLTPDEFAYISSLDQVMRSFEHYSNELKRDYLRTVALNHGFIPQDSFEVTIDLMSETHVMTVTKLDK
jgi:hypothetical protein